MPWPSQARAAPGPIPSTAGSCHLAGAPELVNAVFGFCSKSWGGAEKKGECGEEQDGRGRGRRREKPFSRLCWPVPGMCSGPSVPKR